MATLQSLLTPITQSEYVTILLTQLQANGVPTNQFKDSTQLDYAFTQVFCQAIADNRLSISNYEAAQFLQYSSGDGLTLFAASQYQEIRLTAAPTKGLIRLLSSSSAPNHTFTPGQLILGTQGGDPTTTKYFTNINGGTLSTGSVLDLQFMATAPGSDHNIPDTTNLDLKTSLPGVTVSNPLYPPLSPPTGSWITSVGTDIETDTSLRARCAAKWGTLGRGGTTDAYLYWALAPVSGGTTSPVSRAKIVSNYLGPIAKPAYTSVYVAGPNGPLSAGDLAAVQANFTTPQQYPANFSVLVLNATAVFVPIIGTVYIYRSANVNPIDVQAAVEASLLEYQSSLNIGETGIYNDKIQAWIFSRPADGSNVAQNIAAIRNIDLSAPTGNVTVGYTQYPILQYTGGFLTYTLVDG